MLFLAGEDGGAGDVAVRTYLAHLGIAAQDILPLAIAAPAHAASISASAPSTTTARPETPATADATFLPPLPSSRKRKRMACFRDTDTLHTQVHGTVPTLLYLREQHQHTCGSPPPSQAAVELELLTGGMLDELQLLRGEVQALAAQQSQRREAAGAPEEEEGARRSLRDLLWSSEALIELEERLLSSEEAAAAAVLLATTAVQSAETEIGAQTSAPADEISAAWLAGQAFGVADCAFWPVVQAVRESYASIEGMGNAMATVAAPASTTPTTMATKEEMTSSVEPDAETVAGAGWRAQDGFANIFPALERWVQHCLEKQNLGGML